MLTNKGDGATGAFGAAATVALVVQGQHGAARGSTGQHGAARGQQGAFFKKLISNHILNHINIFNANKI